VKQFVLVAGVDYEFTGVDFRQLADNRRRLLERGNTARADLRFVTMDVRAGEVEVRDVTFPGGKRTETVTSTKPFTPVTRASYQTTGGHTRFKPGQWSVMGITDAYRRVQDIGGADPGTLAELSVFSHGWMGGPILVDSDDDRTTEITIPSLSGTPITITVPLLGTIRDPDDKDARAHLDFRPPTMDATQLDLFQKAFDSNGRAWLWGCSFPRAIHHTLWAMEQAKGYSGVGLGDDVVLSMPAVVDEDVAFLNRFLGGVSGFTPFTPRSSSVSLAFKFLKHAFCRANRACYAAVLADAGHVPVHAAPLGTYADYDTGGDHLMNVYSGFTAHFTFYKNYLGFSFDPEGRRYAVYQPGLSCPAP
jgi:hypothetical protein